MKRAREVNDDSSLTVHQPVRLMKKQSSEHNFTEDSSLAVL